MIASIFGRKLDGTGKRINYKEVFDKAIDQGRLVKFNQGSLVIKGIRYHYPTGYLVPFETIDAIV